MAAPKVHCQSDITLLKIYKVFVHLLQVVDTLCPLWVWRTWRLSNMGRVTYSVASPYVI